MKKLVLALCIGLVIVLAGCHHGYYGGRISYSHHDEVYTHGQTSHYGGYSHYRYGYGYSRGHHGPSPAPHNRGHGSHSGHGGGHRVGHGPK